MTAAADPLTRRLPLAGATNARDLGGLPVSGGTVAAGAVVRSDALTGLTDADRAALTDLGLGTVIDFRAAPEVELYGADVLPGGAASLALPIPDVSADGAAELGPLIMAGDAAGVGALLGDGRARQIMLDGYTALVRRPAARAAFGSALAAIAEAQDAVLFHCQAGKDRTGWMAALLLTVLGADRDTIVADYLASNLYLAERYTALYAGLSDAGIDPDLLRPLTEQHADYLLTAVSTAEADYGSVQEYLRRGLGLTETATAALRARLVH